MEKSIRISNIKGINNLTFEFPSQKGVFYLVGPNGAGKTTLLICMDRLCNPYAFARGFYQPKNVKGYDRYINSEVEYSVNGSSIVFRKGNTRWTSTPKKGNATFLHKFGFNETIFIKADSRRIDATQDEIKKGKVESANTQLKADLNEIFSTSKYDNLCRLRVGKQGGANYYFIIKEGSNYYTEKRFSTGEIAILHLIEDMRNAKPNSLVLLDEAEMALHPRVQVKLMAYLNKVAQEKDLTVFVSTHSTTLIRANKPETILLLEETSDGEIEVITPCYPARAMDGIDYEEAKIFDFIFFVEDEAARSALKVLVNKYFALAPKHATALTSIVPVGGYWETSHMALNTRKQILGFSKVYALVDKDAFDDLKKNPGFKQLLKENPNVIFNLGFTPELKFIEVFTNASADLRKQFRLRFHCEIPNILQSQEYKECFGPERQKAKAQFRVFIDKCSAACADKKELIEEALVAFVMDTFQDCEIKAILGPVFSCEE